MLKQQTRDYITFANGICVDELHHTWLSLVNLYAEAQLTYRSDALPALSGLANAFQDKLQDQYLAGIWRGDMIRGLFWRT